MAACDGSRQAMLMYLKDEDLFLLHQKQPSMHVVSNLFDCVVNNEGILLRHRLKLYNKKIVP